MATPGYGGHESSLSESGRRCSGTSRIPAILSTATTTQQTTTFPPAATLRPTVTWPGPRGHRQLRPPASDAGLLCRGLVVAPVRYRGVDDR